MPTGVWAAVEVQLQARERIAEPGLQVLDENVEPRLRLRDREVAVRLAGAGDRLGAERVARQRQAELLEPLGDAHDVARRHRSEKEVLLPCHPHVLAELRRKLGDRDHLFA